MKNYKYLLLDNDGTLMDFVKAQAVSFELTYNSMPQSALIPFSPVLLEIYDKCNKKWWAKLEKGECTKSELQYMRFNDFLDEIGMPGDGEEYNKVYGSILSTRRDMLPNAVDTMKKLSSFYDIYIITNGVTTTQHGRIDNCDFAPYFKKMYVSEETGFAKPDKKYFDFVMQDIGDTDKSQYLIVGDSLASDILGAKNAQIDAIWVNPDNKDNEDNLPVIKEISNISELIDFLEI